MSQDEDRLNNFVDLARENAAMLVPSIVAAFLAATIFQSLVALFKRRENPAFRAVQVGVFFTTLIDSANIVSLLAFDRSSTAEKIQIVGASVHVIASFVWHLVLHALSGIEHDVKFLQCTTFLASTFVLAGEIIETVAVIETLTDEFVVIAVCLVAVTGILGTVWLCIELARGGDGNEEHLATLRRPVVMVGEMLYAGTIAVAAVQNWRNIFLILPEVPLDLIEYCVVSYRGRQENRDENKRRTHSGEETFEHPFPGSSVRS